MALLGLIVQSTMPNGKRLLSYTKNAGLMTKATLTGGRVQETPSVCTLGLAAQCVCQNATAAGIKHPRKS
jgi:hypothetical protein